METQVRARRARVRSFFGVSFVVWSLLSSGVLPVPACAAAEPGTGSIRGKVQESGGGPAPGAKVTLVELRRSVEASTDGTFQFDQVPPGTWLIEIVSPKFGSAVVTAPVAAGQTADLTVRLDLTVHHEDVVVSAGPLVQSAASVAQPVSVLDGTDLQAAVQPTL
ncbi:MAG TPA: carboxypeptidase-like regulatory domain-containing protein, partial [Candidatus Polarisedimenticolia bacterium]|nr:carboxypeptidase-like regulatory domain-containing protein [Candidatus Polarisedimenticolia bacterium]